jgi:hypothetical protein
VRQPSRSGCESQASTAIVTVRRIVCSASVADRSVIDRPLLRRVVCIRDGEGAGKWREGTRAPQRSCPGPFDASEPCDRDE